MKTAVQALWRKSHIFMLVKWHILDSEVTVLAIAACNKICIATKGFLSNTHAKQTQTAQFCMYNYDSLNLMFTQFL